MRIHRALPPLLLLAVAEAKDVHELPSQPHQQQQQRQIIPLAVRKMSLDEGEKFFPEQYYGFDGGDDSRFGAVHSRTDGLGRSLAVLFSFGRRSVSIATEPETIEARSDDGRWPVVSRRTPDERSIENPEGDSTDIGAVPPPTNMSEATYTARLFPQAYLPAFPVHQAIDDDSQRQSSITDSANPAVELVRRAADALARLQRRQWGCPTGTSSCESIGYPYSCCTDNETCYKVTDTGLGPVGCCPAGETCGGAVSDCKSDSTACPKSLGGGCCIAGYVCQGVGCVKSSSAGASTAASTAASTSASASSSTPTSSTSVTTTSSPASSSTTSSTASTTSGGNPPVKQTLTTTASGLPAGYCPTGYYACVASAGGGCCQTGRNCETTSCPPAPATTTIVNTNGVTVVVPQTAAEAVTTSSATCASGWFLCGANAGPVAGCCPSGYACGTASCSLTGASATTVQKELPTAGDGSSTSSGVQSIAGIWWLAVAVASIPPLLLL
ncbi:GPI anchored protein [Sporothrix schenckii 1099-18]|uniref:GPI anchored protein n=1 Tax=Sporothrix schenckii 1099-18 TaxID=1397361 RepID=A0A0F2M0H3_SPOSC|nr:GPI anchored protein [Sporothrix schenckii 1099-18]KJR83213.1 GPI anchored protein [Sporothrix schenckii 1099-18]